MLALTRVLEVRKLHLEDSSNISRRKSAAVWRDIDLAIGIVLSLTIRLLVIVLLRPIVLYETVKAARSVD